MADMSRALGLAVDRKKVEMLGDVDMIMFQQASLLRDDIVRGWPVAAIGGGASRAGWQGPIKIDTGAYRVTNNYVYGPTIEYGGYPGVGPKTAEFGGASLPEGYDINPGIYPTQRPQAPVRRALSKRAVALKKAFE